MTAQTVAYCTLGCRLNQYDSEALRGLLERDGGYRTVPFHDNADIYVVNTCSVTARADATARKTIRRIHQRRPGARILVTGCYAQRAPGELADLPGVSVILGAADRAKVVAALAQPHGNRPRQWVSPIAEAVKFLEVPITEMLEHTRAFVKIQEGCDESCAFCIIPATRGRSRSREPDKVLEQIRTLIGSGYAEIVLTGVHLGDYGLDLAQGRRLLADMLREILRIDGLRRLRLSSIEPASISDELVELMASEPRFANHFHIPMQSASDRVLARMRRRYTAGHFAALIRRIADSVPACGIGVDVICGFPGETEGDFQRTFDMLEALPITYIHPFSYSVRPGSEAETFGDDVASDVKKRRIRALKRLAEQKNHRFREAHLGQELPVLLERRPGQADGQASGWTGNYLRVQLQDVPENLDWATVRIGALNERGLVGEIVRRQHA